MIIFKVAFLFDKSNSWIRKHITKKKLNINTQKFSLFFTEKKSEINNFDVVFILGYTKILNKSFLRANKLCLVIHESALPKGRGFSPVQWQILKNKKNIPVSLIKAEESLDSGDIILRSTINLDGSELYDEIRKEQAKVSIKLIEKFLQKYPNFKKYKQKGKQTYFKKRTIKDSELDINKNIKQQFNLLRINNNEGWPSYFKFKNHRYVIHIFKSKKN